MIVTLTREQRAKSSDDGLPGHGKDIGARLRVVVAYGEIILVDVSSNANFLLRPVSPFDQQPAILLVVRVIKTCGRAQSVGFDGLWLKALGHDRRGNKREKYE